MIATRVDVAAADVAILDALPEILRDDPVLGCRGLYAGWDGRLVKFGVASGKEGVRQRRHGYITHNPFFRIVAVLPDRDPSRLLDNERRVLARLAEDAAFVRGDRTAGMVEWFWPTSRVAAAVEDLVAATNRARAALMDRAAGRALEFGGVL